MSADRDPWETVVKQEEWSHNRIVDAAFCTECGDPEPDGEHCEECKEGSE